MKLFQPQPHLWQQKERKSSAEGQQVIAEEEVFQIQHGGAFPERLETGQDVEAERAGRERRNIVTQLTVEAFLRVQPQTSMQ